MVKKFSKEKIKKINKITYIAFTILVLAFALLRGIIKLKENNLLKNGIREKVVVVQKHKSGNNSKYSAYHYYLTVDWFTELETIPYYKTKDTTGLSNAEKMSNDILSEAFKNKGRTTIERNNTPIKLKYITGETHQNVHHGEIVTLVYFKDKPEDGRLLNELE